MFSGDIVEARSACYCGDGHFSDWPGTLTAIRSFTPDALMPGRGDAVLGAAAVEDAIALTEDFLTSTYRPVARVVAFRNGIWRTIPIGETAPTKS